MTTELKKFQEETVTQVMDRLADHQKNGEVRLPANYSVGNSLKLAWLMILETTDSAKKPVLEVCTKESICNALLKMVIQGLNPAKSQCYFIAYGSSLTMQRSYMGTVSVAKRVGGVKSVHGNAIFQGDKFSFEVDVETGRKRILGHTQTLENLDLANITGAYAIVEFEDGTKDAEIMNIVQIRKAWMQGPTKGDSPAHRNFTDEMAIKTVIARACKLAINTSDDGDLFSDDPVDSIPYVEHREAIETGANKKQLDIPVREEPREKASASPTNGHAKPSPQPQMAGPGF
jgi:recombination protein RecT